MTETSELKSSDAAPNKDKAAALPKAAATVDPRSEKRPRAFLASLRAKIGDWRGGLAGW